ncbi:MAG: S8 family serine peptidase, partial [Candidatus Magasanikbacteria bacterium]|nr:S8 family serine peptidase [Candidatus Magasanikbacteria bacterium]
MKRKITSFLFCLFRHKIIFLMPIVMILANFLFTQVAISMEDDRKLGEILYKLKNDKRVYSLSVKEGEVEDKIIELNNRNDVEYAEPNYIYRIAIIPSDVYYNSQWYLKKIRATEAWDTVRESPEIVIAVIDSGVQIDHPDLRDNIWRNVMDAPNNKIDDDKNGYVDDINGWDFTTSTADPSPKFKGEFSENGIMHGTVVAGAIAAVGNNASGISGVTWRSKIMPLKVLSDNGEGEVKNVIRAIDYAVNNGADVINLSFVGFNHSKSMENAIRRAYEAGVIVVAAAGNEQGEGYGYSLDATPLYPACYDGKAGENMVIGVAATDTLDQKAPFSSYGFKCVDISAPGVSIFSTAVYAPNQQINNEFLNKYYDGYWSGTSMATPLVSGTLALIQKANPRLNRQEVIDVLINSTDNIDRLNPSFLGQLGSGRLNVEKAINTAKAKLLNYQAKLIFTPYKNNSSTISIADENGKIESGFMAYSPNFYGGARVQSGDVNGDGEDEIISGTGGTGGPHVKVFSAKGELISQFFAFDKNLRSGVKVAVGDLNNDGIAEIITSTGSGNEPLIRIFDYKGNKRRQFLALPKTFRGGINIATGDINGDGNGEIVITPESKGGPQLRIFNQFGELEGQFFAYDKNYRGGV